MQSDKICHTKTYCTAQMNEIINSIIQTTPFSCIICRAWHQEKAQMCCSWEVGIVLGLLYKRKKLESCFFFFFSKSLLHSTVPQCVIAVT